MKNFAPNEPNFDDILPLLSALDGGLLHALQGQGLPIIVVTAVPAVSRIEDTGSGNEGGQDDEDELDAAPNTSPPATVVTAALMPAPNAASACASTSGRNSNEQYHLPCHGQAWPDHHSL